MNTIPGVEVVELVPVLAPAVIPGMDVYEMVPRDSGEGRAKTIPLEAVRNALMCAVIKQKTRGHEVGGKPHGRIAAYTYYAPMSSVTCRTARPGQRRRHFPGMNFGVMERGDLGRLIERVRLFHGLAEVRRTWNLGLRALQAEIGNGIMR